MGRTRVIATMLVLAACGGPTAGQAPDPFPDVELGTVEEFRTNGVTELFAPQTMFVVADDDNIDVFWAKDPNIGCRLFLVADIPDLTTDVPAEAVFYDQCRGRSYDGEGQPLGGGDLRPMWALRTEQRDGMVVWVRDE